MRTLPSSLAAAAAASLIVAATAKANVVVAVDLGTPTSNVYQGTFTSPVDSTTANFVGGSFSDGGGASSFSVAGDPSSSSGTIGFAVTNDVQTTDRGIGSFPDAGTYSDIYRDLTITQGGTLTISGLNDNTQYGVVIQSFEPALDSQVSTFTPVTTLTVGVNPAAQGTVDDSENNYSPANYLYDDPNYPNVGNVAFFGANALTTDATGNIVFDLGGTSGYTRINGIEIFTEVPEPASLGLLSLGALGLLARRRRN